MYTLAPGVIGHIVSERKNNADYYFHYDPIGNVQFITDCYGNVTVSYVQEGFGNVLATNGSLTSDNWHLTSKQLEPETGLYFFYARWYDPVVGRFITKDPIPSLYPYLYALDNPMLFIDPDGRDVYQGRRGYHCYLWTPQNPGFGKYPEFGGPISPGIIWPEPPWNQKKPPGNPMFPGNCCFENCVNDSKNKDAGWFVIIGANCWHWCEKVIEDCRSQCNLPPLPPQKEFPAGPIQGI